MMSRSMASRNIGVWLVGAWGGVATTVVTGLTALKRGMADTTGLVSAKPPFDGLDLVGWDDLVIGGHEIRETSYAAEARVLHEQSHVFPEAWLTTLGDDLQAIDQRIQPGTLHGVGQTIESLAGPKARAFKTESAGQAVARLAKDIEQFRAQNGLATVIVVNVSSTEPPVEDAVKQLSWAAIQKQLDTNAACPLPASTLYAIAAFRCQCPYVNFTPSIGTDLPALDEFAKKQSVVHVGRDGKTGETLMKAVLAPMFAARNLQVMSWVGHNIFGNLDGKVLDDPVNKANKVRSKDHLLTEILGYKPQTLVSIEYIESMGDWKTAWDHIHFKGFLGTPMVLQFLWQGCDSLLAAPLVIDLIRLTEREARRGKSGVMGHLASFFKSPMSCDEPAFALQFEQLLRWADEVRNGA
ncbi:MAG TPA: inositol-3-phosphate synthase [Planctomycetaceae bacterium]|nr:inositol-3-phosphate synthase [Planctomycetaceae bacterium]